MASTSLNNFENMMRALIETSSDHDELVAHSARESLTTIGQQAPPLLLNSVHAYLANNTKMRGSDRGHLLEIVAKICNEHLAKLDEQLCSITINLAINEMTQIKEIDEQWQAGPSEVLVILGSRFCCTVMEGLLQKFQRGTLPHGYVLRTIGALAIHSPKGFVPFLQDVLNRCVPMLANVKIDNLKFAFTVALKQLAESLIAYTSLADESSLDPTITKEKFAGDFEKAFDIIVNNWSMTKDYSLRATVITCVGELCHVISNEKLLEEIKKLVITIILPQYKKGQAMEKYKYGVSMGLCRLLEATISNEDKSKVIVNYLEDIWVSIFPLICIENMNSNDSVAISLESKNRSEVLRCFHITACVQADRLLYYLVQKVQTGTERQKLGAVHVIRYLVDTSGAFIERALIMRGVAPIVVDQNISNKVRKKIVELVISLAEHDYLDADNGGMGMLAFVIRCMVVADDQQPKKNDPEYTSSKQLRLAAAQALQTIAKNHTKSSLLLWPYLFEYLCVEAYHLVVIDICKTLLAICDRFREEKVEIKIDPVRNGESDIDRIPGPHQILARLFVLAGTLHQDAGVPILLLKYLAPIYHQSTFVNSKEWNATSDNLYALATGDNDNHNCNEQEIQWHTQILKWVVDTTIHVQEGEWRQHLASAFGKQFHLYNHCIDSKAFLHKCLGGVLSKIVDEQFVVNHVQLMFKSTDHSNSVERQGCAQGVGYAATTHSDTILVQLENVAKWENQKKSSGWFGFMKDSSNMTSTEASNLRATILLTYGYLIWYCPIDVVTQRYEKTVIRFLREYIDNAKDSVIKCAVVHTIGMIARSLHKSHLLADYTLQERQYFLKQLKEYLATESAETATNVLRVLCANTAAHLTQLDPPLPDQELLVIGHALGKLFYCLKSAKVMPTYGADLQFDTAITPLYNFYARVLRRLPTLPTLTVLLRISQSFYSSTVELERQRAFDAALFLIETYFENANDCSVGKATSLSILGANLARFIPRICDDSVHIRVAALACVQKIISTANLHKGLMRTHTDAAVDNIKENESDLRDDNAQSHLSVVLRLSNLVESRLPPQQMQSYLSVLFDVLLDAQANVSTAAALLMKRAIALRGEHLQQEAPLIVITILAKLPQLKSIQTYGEALQALVECAIHHLPIVLHQLLAQPLPFKPGVTDSWSIMSSSPNLFPPILDFLLQSIDNNDDQVYDTSDQHAAKYVKADTLANTQALLVVIKSVEQENLLVESFPRLICALLVHSCALVDTKFAPTSTSQVSVDIKKEYTCPAQISSKSIELLLARLGLEGIITNIVQETGNYADFDDPLHSAQAVHILCKSMSIYSYAYVQPVFELMLDRLSHNCNAHRIAAMAAISAFVKFHPDKNGSPDHQFFTCLVDTLVRSLADTSLIVRKFAIRGLGDVSHAGKELLEKYTQTALTAIMSGLEDPGDHKDQIALESMQALNKLSTRLEQKHIQSILVNVLLRIRPCFEKESAALRSVSFALYARLAAFGQCVEYNEQLHTNIIATILHTFDDEVQVQQACIDVWKSTVPLLNSDAFTDACQPLFNLPNTSSDSINQLTYRAFLNQAAAALAKSFGDRLNFYALCCSNYLKATSVRIRANATLFIGYLLGAIAPQQRSTISKDLLFANLSLMLKEQEVEVRLAATEAISHLYGYY